MYYGFMHVPGNIPLFIRDCRGDYRNDSDLCIKETRSKRV